MQAFQHGLKVTDLVAASCGNAMTVARLDGSDDGETDVGRVAADLRGQLLHHHRTFLHGDLAHHPDVQWPVESNMRRPGRWHVLDVMRVHDNARCVQSWIGASK